MASKKGITLTILILIGITSASFVIWFVPENNEMTFIVSDFETHLDSVKDIHKIISETVDNEFQNLLNGETSPQNYIKQVKTSSSQINSQIMQLVESKATEEWQESYINYIESLKQYNSYLRETIVVATLIDDGAELNEIENVIQKINELRENSESLILKSDNSRP